VFNNKKSVDPKATIEPGKDILLPIGGALDLLPHDNAKEEIIIIIEEKIKLLFNFNFILIIQPLQQTLFE
jgi:hypothetical protein